MDSSDLQNETPEANETSNVASPVTIHSLQKQQQHQSDEAALIVATNGIKSSASKINMLIENLSKSNSKNLKLASSAAAGNGDTSSEAPVANLMSAAAETLLEIKNKSSSSLNRSELENRSNLSYNDQEEEEENNSNNSSVNLSESFTRNDRFCDEEEEEDEMANGEIMNNEEEEEAENLSLHSSNTNNDENNMMMLKEMDSDNEEEEAAADNHNNNTYNDETDGKFFKF
jgi:hypothetical protein